METCLKPPTVPEQQKRFQQAHQNSDGSGKGELQHPVLPAARFYNGYEALLRVAEALRSKV